MMKRILLPTDFSDSAWNAMFTVLKLFPKTPCQFYLLHTYEPSFANVLGDKGKTRLGVIYDSMGQHAEQQLNKVLDYVKKNHGNRKHVFKTLAKSDDLISATKEVIRELDIDLLVMGTSGATGAKEIFMGSHTVKMIKNLRKRPVLVVPEHYNFQKLDQVVFPTDFTRTFESFELEPLLELVALWGANISVFQVAQEFALSPLQQSNKSLLQKRLETVAHSFHTVDMKVDVAKAIMDFAEEKDADMIALIHYSHTFLEKLTREPVVKKVAFHSQFPILILPE